MANIHHHFRYAIHQFINDGPFDFIVLFTVIVCAAVGAGLFAESSRGVGLLAGIIWGSVCGHAIIMILEDLRWRPHLPWNE